MAKYSANNYCCSKSRYFHRWEFKDEILKLLRKSSTCPLQAFCFVKRFDDKCSLFNGHLNHEPLHTLSNLAEFRKFSSFGWNSTELF